jgi:repressor LexA
LGIARINLEGGEASGVALQPIGRRVPVVGTVQAGAWVEQAVIKDPSEVDSESTEWLSFDEPQYRGVQLFALIVQGESANLRYPDKTRVICALPQDVGIHLGDFVAVRRRQGPFFETTLKEIQIGPDGAYELWPRSTHPDFQKPIRYVRDEHAQDGPEIIGVVVGDYRVGRSGGGQLLDI